MFRILVLDEREGIRLGLKYLLYRYELVFGTKENSVQLLNEDKIDLILVNLVKQDGSYSNWELLKEWAKRKKTIVITDSYTQELAEDVKTLGALTCIDKIDLHKLPHLVETYLNQASTRVIDVSELALDS